MLSDEFNAAFKNIDASYLKVDNEIICMLGFINTENGNLTHLYYIFHKSEPLGMGFHTELCYFTGVLIFIEIQT